MLPVTTMMSAHLGYGNAFIGAGNIVSNDAKEDEQPPTPLRNLRVLRQTRKERDPSGRKGCKEKPIPVLFELRV